MSTLVFETRYLGLFAQKDRAPSTTSIFGSGVFARGFLDAILRYGTFERCCILGDVAPDDRHDLAAHCVDGRTRLQFIDTANFEQLQQLEQPVLVDPNVHYFHNFRTLRRLLSVKRDWPITGVTLSIHANTVPAWFLQVVFGDARRWDALVCSSKTSLMMIQDYLDALPESYPELASVPYATKVQLPVIPLGTDAFRHDPQRRVAVRSRWGAAPDDVVLLYLGRLSPALKCDLVPLLLAVAALAPDTRSRARLVIAGDDTRHRMADRLREAASTLGCERVIVCPDPTHQDKLDAYGAADIFVSPSDNVQETFGLTLIEAMAAGLPIVASDWNGYRDLVTPGQTGLLVPTHAPNLGEAFDRMGLTSRPDHDGTLAAATAVDVGQLTECLRLLITDSARRLAMGRRAEAVFQQRFDWQVVIRQYEGLWSELRTQASQGATQALARPAQPLMLRQIVRRLATTITSDEARLQPGRMAAQVDTLLAISDAMPVPRPASTALVRMFVDAVSLAPTSLADLVALAIRSGVADGLSAHLALGWLLKYEGVRLESSLPQSQDAQPDLIDR